MARRRKPIPQHECQLTASSAMGHKEFVKVIDAIDRHATKLATLEMDLEGENSITIATSLFADETRRALITAHQLSALNNSSIWYGLYDDANIWISGETFDKMGMLMPAEHCVLRANAEVLRPKLHATYTKLRAIRRDIALLEHLVAWLDANASVSAMRYYWPAILSLSPGCLGDAPLSDRHVTPSGVGAYVPLMREMATLVARFQMLPDPPDKPRVGLSISFPEHDMEWQSPSGNLISFKARERTFPI